MPDRQCVIQGIISQTLAAKVRLFYEGSGYTKHTYCEI